MKFLVLWLLLGITQLQAQMSHSQLTHELIKDLERAVADSVGQDSLKIVFVFQGETSVTPYLQNLRNNSDASYAGDSSRFLSLPIEILDFSMSIDRPGQESAGNMKHRRLLKLSVQFSWNEQTFGWAGTTSDQLSTVEVGKLLNESFPKVIGGDFRSGEPHRLIIVLSTLTLFGILTALFFVRT